MALAEAINLLDNKGSICMLLNLKMRHKPNVNCWSSRLFKIAFANQIIITIIWGQKYEKLQTQNCKIIITSFLPKHPQRSWFCGVILLQMAYFCHCCMSITSKNDQLPTHFRRSCQGFYPPHHHHPHDHPHHHHHHHHHPSHYHCHDNLFRSWRSTMSWGPKLPKGKNLASQRLLLWWVWWMMIWQRPCLELLLWWFGMIMMIVSGSGQKPWQLLLKSVGNW